MTQEATETVAPVTPAQDAAKATETAVQATAEEPFDKERAMATIAKLREFEKTAIKQQKELDALRARVQSEDDAKKSDLEKAQAAAQEATARAEAAERKAKETALRAAVLSSASKLGIVDPDAAHRLLDWNDIEWDGDQPKGVEERLQQLVKEKRYLLGGSTNAANPERGGASDPQKREAELRAIMNPGAGKTLWDINRIRGKLGIRPD